MKIRNKVMLVLSVYLVLLIVLAGALSYTTKQMGEAHAKGDFAHQIVHAVFDLDRLSGEILVLRNNRNVMQWRSKYEQLGALVDPNKHHHKDYGHEHSLEELKLFENMYASHEKLGVIFEKLADENTSDVLKDRLFGQMDILTDSMISDSFRLAKIAGDTILNAQKRDNLFNTVILSTLFVLFLFTVLFFVKSVITPLSDLRYGAFRIGKGDLNFNIKIKRDDEIGELGKAFNSMAKSLKMRIREIKKQQQFTGEMLDALNDVFYVFDKNGKFILWNKAFEKVTGYSGKELKKKKPWELFTKEGGKNIVKAIKNVFTKGRVTVEEDFFTKSKKKVPMFFSGSLAKDIKGRPILVGVGKDITELKAVREQLREVNNMLETRVKQRTKDLNKTNIELKKEMGKRKKAEAERVQSAKLATVGTLAAGVAHELNNPLMGIINYIGYSKKHIPSKSKAVKVLEDAEKEVNRCSSIVKNLLTFSRSNAEGKENLKSVDIVELYSRVEKLLGYRLRDIKLEKKINKVPKVNIKENQVQQVILNLINNAVDALEGVKDAKIKVELERVGDRVAFSVYDNGKPIPKEMMQRIFDPFYTTKAPGKGTGLGLSISRKIIEDHGGKLLCESGKKGTKFTIWLKIKGKVK